MIDKIILKRPTEIEIMAEAGSLLSKVHQRVGEAIRPGVSTQALNKIAEHAIFEFGARPAFLGYNGYPATINASVNEVVVHGVPGPRILGEGDIVSIDCGLVHKGFFVDCARTYAVGEISLTAQRLIDTAKKALKVGITEAQPGARLGDISHAIQKVVEGAGFHVVRKFVGHGIGRSMHEEPQVPNWGRPGKGILLKPGLVIAIEPMITVNRVEINTLADGWTEVTHDQSIAVQVEDTIAVTEIGPRILTG